MLNSIRFRLIATSLALSVAAAGQAQTFRIIGTGGNTYGYPPSACQFDITDDEPLSDERSCDDGDASWDQSTNCDRGLFEVFRHVQWHSSCGCTLGTENHGRVELIQFNDLIFTGPAGATSVETRFQVDLSGTTETDSAGGLAFAGIRAFAQVFSRVADTGDTTGFSGRLTSDPVTLPLNTPIYYNFTLYANTSVRGPGVPSATADASMQLPVGEPVFILPEGYTANSPALNIVDNMWLGVGTPTPNLMGAVSRRACDLPLDLSGATRTSEPRQGGITEVCFTYDDAAPSGPVIVEEDASCPSPPAYGAYTGAAVATCSPDGNDMCCTFAPALENALSYRLTVPSGSGTAQVELRGLLGDVNADGFTNATDRSVVVGVWTGASHFSCATDLNSDDATNATDRSIVVGAWTSGSNCAP